MAVIDSGTSTAGKANVDSEFNLRVNMPGSDSTGVSRGGGSANAGAVAAFSEVDEGAQTGARLVRSPEVDSDYRMRVAVETQLDNETFNYTAQNTGKHNFVSTTMVSAWAAGGFSTNSTNILTTTTGVRLRTYSYFPLYEDNVTYVDLTLSLSAAVAPTNTIVDFGLFNDAVPGTPANPYTPGDGAFFRVTSAGVLGVISIAGSETTVGPFVGFTPVANQKYKFLATVSERRVTYWIDDVLYGTILVPGASGQMFQSASLPFALRHVITGGVASAAYNVVLGDYSVSLGGAVFTNTLSQSGNRMLGAHQGLSGGTMGSLASYANSTTPAGGAGLNTAALATGLGGQATLNAAAAAVTDFILTSYQVPLGTIAVQGRRLALYGVRISAANLGAAVTTTETTLAYSLAFGHTAVSLATAEAANAKAPRREPLGILSWAIGSAIGAGPREDSIIVPFTQPIYVNPGEFVAVAAKFLAGTATGAQTIYNQIAFDYGWE